MKFWLLGGILITLVALLVLLGMVYQQISTVKDLSKYPPPGQLIDVGGYRLHLHCKSQGHPTVVMDYGLGGISPLWYQVQSQVAKFTSVCVYDRAGYGWSEPSPHPRTSLIMVQELHTLLKKGGIAGPYLLVGHSLGGLNMRLFASQYPSEVVGVVLVDAVPANVYSRLGSEFRENMAATRQMFGSLSIISRLGILRLLLQLKGSDVAPEFVQKLPPSVQSVVLAKFLPQSFNTALAESALLEKDAELVSQTSFPSHLPLVVISHGLNMFSGQNVEAAESIWRQLQAETSQLSTSGSLQIADGSGHNIHIDQPQLVVDAIRKILEQINVKEKTNEKL
ncbi:MAG: alpha/beta hydrolase [Microcystis panniformis Mp_MB_F_20051200_S9]|jgi:pimeloyl-ACP methyl ester carboxylesterase|uniref:Alpha/beta hydrolase n=1 Tax=Microcystis panniformis Mp_MB_F_20051200_S9 TaxID=2486223 RepID=A0A552QBH9_9CHRO|nr:MAG: alpha/beta hydrolase [Microcystis panniformis Mp_MB_F_20080800_S26D]TRV47814.1 MAG: alpha/beta hydrolase [Microcystis panniformis Mp_GB_SS_20050300_S99]TRV53197.1 MAG: alpha/beta hydrolase [Microcystis panniformis Mp_GB_SS_20050300_S99D]TRV59770.1 MAG: alpha/beta hydrolase [Microcystis panniformis Mp_MB_F_20051200_S9D]TRV64274.1 MAG: alpha/beta hydrolase [Microcystis panniformis Mp_MB_F_20080800_S26]TRV66551.1 MAG: alpha/beta hydrolase [Microcystis panniformis Mp_MB_F_20051200_S9]TRV7